jgi:quinol monooxygenase YgiN
MDASRRTLLAWMSAAAALAAGGMSTVAAQPASYGRIGSLTAAAGQRDALIAALLAGASRMPGCVSYVVGKDTTNPDVIWITELWVSQASHAASLSLPQVREAITKAKPLIAGFGLSIVTEPVADVA